MKQFILDRHTAPGTPSLEQVPTDKIPVYETKTAAENDLANLEVGQIIATKDEGNELSNPVDVVQDGNMHAVTSNAVADAFKLSPIEDFTLSTTNQTIQYDGILFFRLKGNNSSNTEIYINDVKLIVGRVANNDEDTIVFPVCKGDTFRINKIDTVWVSSARWYKNR